jgi:RNA polymerase sigma factor (TIGR02999 family)
LTLPCQAVILERMSEVSQILSAIERGEPHAADQLLPLVYDELRKLAAAKLAQEKPGQTLQATALVHEAYLRLVDVEQAQHWDSRRHFFAAAAESMRRILLDRARDKRRLKRGGSWRRLRLDQLDIPVEETSDDLLALDEAVQKLAQEDPLCAELVKLRFFAGPDAGGGRPHPGTGPPHRRSLLGLRTFLALRRAAPGRRTRADLMDEKSCGSVAHRRDRRSIEG